MSLIAERNRKSFGSLGPFLNGQPIEIVRGSMSILSDNVQNYIKNGYNFNDIVFSIINLILDKVRVAPWALYDMVDESSLKALHSYQRKSKIDGDDLRQMVKLRKKSFSPVKDPGKIGDLLKYPNGQETFSDFVAAGCGYKLLTGNKYVWADMLDGGANKGLPNSLHVMPSQWVRIMVHNGWPPKVLGYEIFILGLFGELGFTDDEVMHEKYKNYDFSASGAQLYGTAPLKAGMRLLNRNNSAMDAATAKFQNGGIEAIIFPKNSTFDAKEAFKQISAVKEKLISEYTGTDNWGKIAASGYEVGVEKMGMSPVELAINQAEMQDLRRFCNLFGVRSELLNDPDNKTFNNSKEAEKALTVRAALPLLTSFRDNLNRKFQQSWGMKKNQFIDFDMTVFSELQETVGESLRWIQPLLQQGWPLNRALESLNMETIDAPEADEMWINPNMGQPITEWRISEVDASLNSGA